MGRVTAGFTHELKNVLAIIKESAGLMEDLISFSKEAPFPHRERFSRAIKGIQEQVHRGVELSTRLNRFAHSPDNPLAAIDLNDTLQQLALLSERFARLKGTVIEVGPAEQALSLVTSPIGFQMALYTAMELCWNLMPAGGTVRIAAEKVDDGIAVCVACAGAELGSRSDFMEKAESAQGWPSFRANVEALGARFDWESSTVGFCLVFSNADA